MRNVNLTAVIFGAVSGLLLACCLPWPGIWPLAWVGLVPLLRGMTILDRRRTALCAAAAGIVYYLLTLYWLMIFGFAPWIVLSLIQTVFLVAFALVGRLVMPGRIGWVGYLAVPGVWVVMQWARALGMFGFTWGSLAHTQANTLSVIQIASIGGCWLVDFVVCLVSLFFAETVHRIAAKERDSLRPAFAGVAIIAIVVGYGVSVLRQPENYPTATAVAVQGSVEQDVVADQAYLRATMSTYMAGSFAAERSRPQFVVWPETTISTDLAGTEYEEGIKTVARVLRTNVIVGAYHLLDTSRPRNLANSAYVYSPEGIVLGIYSKVRLLPFGEFVPMRRFLPFVDRYGVRPYDVLPGRGRELVQTDVGPIGISICFESLFPDIMGKETRDGASALFVLTNDAWFERTQAAQQHLMMSRLRAVENRRSVVRAAATGISAIIDPHGQITSQLDIFRQGNVTGRIQLRNDLTLYARLGDWWVVVCGILAAIGLAIARHRTR